MAIYEASASIRATSGDVWRVLADVEQWPRWLTTVHSVEALDGPGLRVATRFRVVQPALPPAVWFATMVDPARGFTWESTSPAARVVAEHLLSSQPDGTTDVVLRVSFDGLLGKLMGRFARATTRRYLAQEAVALKQTVEQGRADAA